MRATFLHMADCHLGYRQYNSRERLLALRNSAQMLKQAVAEQERTLAAAQQRLAESEEAVTITEANRAGHEAYRGAPS